MKRFVIAGLIWLGLSLPALANCSGTDLRDTMTAEETRQLQDFVTGQPFATGNHWRATRGDDVVHLIGTMHLDDPRFDEIVPRLQPVMRDAALLMLEMTDVEQAEMQAKMASDPDFLVLPDTTLPELLEPEEWDILRAAAQARGLPPFMVAKFRPWYVSMILSIPACIALTQGMDGGLDSKLEEIANAEGIPTQALEDPTSVFEAFEAAPLDMQIDMLRASLTDPGASEDFFTTMLNAYFEEAHAESWGLAEVLSPRLSPLHAQEMQNVFDMMTESLLVNRNRAWIPRILAAVEQTDGLVVTAFGAAHMGGADGVAALLEAEGFLLERLPF